jgi:hypothetical protein
MNTYINFADSLTADPLTDDDSYNLEQLANLIEEDCDLPVEREKADSGQGVKDGGLTIGLTVVGLVISAIGTFIAALTYWKSQQPKYSLTVSLDGKILSIDNLSPEKVQEAITELNCASFSLSSTPKIEIKISK